MAKKRKSLIEHRMGRRSGYDAYPDGSIGLAPMWTDRLEVIHAREIGLREMQYGVTVYVTDQFAHLATEKKRWWDEVFEELEIDRGSGERWEFANGVVRRAASGMEAATAGETPKSGSTEGDSPVGSVADETPKGSGR